VAEPFDASAWAQRVRDGDRPALARAITWLEDALYGEARGAAVLAALWPQVGRARRIGITGPPGVGKSTVVSGLIAAWRAESHTVGVVAVDPTSPLTGGALLGDRVRMQKPADPHDDGLFIRSMASRGTGGGLALAAQDVADLLDAAGRDIVAFETVGVGQLEVDVAGAADTTVVVLSPESGDGMQAMKAGLIEVADVIAVNKADREGAARLAGELNQALDLVARAHAPEYWRPPVVEAIAVQDGGLDALRAALAAHAAWLAESDRLATARAGRLAQRIRALTTRSITDAFWGAPGTDERLAAEVEAVRRGDRTPAQAAAELFGA
jgi:LAO/AO transport system kinase